MNIESSAKSFGYLFAAGLLSSLLLGCTSSVQSEQYPGVDVSQYKTFALSGMRDPSRTIAAVRPEITPILIRDVRSRVSQALVKHGLVADAEDADLTVLIHGAVIQRVDIEELGYYIGPRGRVYGWDQNGKAYEEGTLVIDLVDTASKEIVWRGWRTQVVDRVPRIEVIQHAIDSIVAEIPR